MSQSALADYTTPETTEGDEHCDAEPMPGRVLSAREVAAHVESFVDGGRAPRLDLEVERECTTETVRELIRRKWDVGEIAAYCQVSEPVVQRKLATLDVGPHKSHGTPTQPGASQLLWYTHPSTVPQ
jgi:hypothetical protein